MTTTSGFLGLSTRGLARALNWAPTLTSHDPNPPLPLESPPPASFGGEEIHQAPMGRPWALAFAVVPAFAFSASDELPTYTPPAPIADEADAPAQTTWPVRHRLHTAYDDGAPTEWDLPARSRLTLELDFTDTSTLTLTGSLIDAVADQSGYGRDFTQTGDNRPTSQLDGILGQAATFIVDGSTDDWMEATATVADLTNASEWTIVARIRVGVIASGLASTYGDGVLFPYGVSGPGIHLRSDGAGDDRAYAINEDGGWPPDECYVSIDLDTELILIAKLESGTLSIRLGSGTPATVSSGNVTATTETWRLGYAPGGGNWLDGAIGNVLAWDKALSSDEIASLLEWFEARKPKRGWLGDEPSVPATRWPGRWIHAQPADRGDDLPAYTPPAFAPAEDGAPAQVVWARTGAATIVADEEIVSALAVALLDDGAWEHVTWRVARATQHAIDDEAPAGSLRGCPVEDHEAHGQAPPFPRHARWRAETWTDDDLPAGSMFGVPVEEHAPHGLAPPFPRLLAWAARTATDDDVPAGALFGVPHEEAGAPAAEAPRSWWVAASAVDDEWALAPVVAEEPGQVDVVWAALRIAGVHAHDDDPAGALFGAVDVDPMAPAVVWPLRMVGPAQGEGDDQLPVMQAPALEEGGAGHVVWGPRWAAAPDADDDALATPAATPALDDGARAQQPPWGPVAWAQPMAADDEIATVTAVAVVEDYAPGSVVWSAAAVAAAQAHGDDLCWSVVDDADAGPLQVRWGQPRPAAVASDDDAWRPVVPDDGDATAHAIQWPRPWFAPPPADGAAEEPFAGPALADDDDGLVPPPPWPLVWAQQPFTDDSLRTTIPGVPFVAVVEGRQMTAALEGATMVATIEGGDVPADLDGREQAVSVDGRDFSVDLEGRT